MCACVYEAAGRIRIAAEGINGTVGGSASSCAAYEAATGGLSFLVGIEFKRAAGSGCACLRERECARETAKTKRRGVGGGGRHGTVPGAPQESGRVHAIRMSTKHAILKVFII